MKAEVIRGYLNSKGIFLQDLAEKHGVSGSYMSRILRGSVDESATVLTIKADICRLLEKEPKDVFPGSQLENRAA
jgi:transcriptional regulator with XRE-family HTH domain